MTDTSGGLNVLGSLKQGHPCRESREVGTDTVGTLHKRHQFPAVSHIRGLLSNPYVNIYLLNYCRKGLHTQCRQELKESLSGLTGTVIR